MDYYRIIKGRYVGSVGTIDKDIPGWKRFHNVMFYPIDSIPYRVCKNYYDIEKIN